MSVSNFMAFHPIVKTFLTKPSGKSRGELMGSQNSVDISV